MSEMLEAVFGSKARTRIMRFLLLNAQKEYVYELIVDKNALKRPEARKELTNLKRIKFLKERIRNEKKYYSLNEDFPLNQELKEVFVKANTFPKNISLIKISTIGDVRLILASGVFINAKQAKADLLLVANNISKKRLEKAIFNLEAEIGKEIRYVLLSSEELKYRMDMVDRFLMSFLDGPHEEVVNKVPGLRRFMENMKN